MSDLIDKLHFINGHSHRSQGAEGLETVDGHKLKITEWSYAESLHTRLVTPFTHTDAFNLHQTNRYVTRETVALEFHLNSFTSPTVEGYEVLILEDDLESHRSAKLFLNIMKYYFPNRRNRGIKVLTSTCRGYNNLLRLKKVYAKAILTEAFFINNPNDWINREHMADVINRFNNEINKGELT